MAELDKILCTDSRVEAAKKINAIIENIDSQKINSPYFFGMYIFSEFAPSNLSWLKSSGQWNSGAGYLDFYNWVVTNANNGVANFKLSTQTYTDYDFVANTTNNTFRLPIKVQQKFFDSENIPVAGNGITLGFTNGTVNAGVYSGSEQFYLTTSQFGVAVGTSRATGAFDPDLKTVGITTDETKSGMIAKLGNAENTTLGLYFYVGETIKNQDIIDVAEIASVIADKIGRAECKAYITETYKNGASWYRVYSDGWCEQGGIFTSSTGGYAARTATFLKPFKNTNYIAFAEPNDSEGDASAHVLGTKTTTAVTFIALYNKNGTANWIAKGYIA